MIRTLLKRIRAINFHPAKDASKSKPVDQEYIKQKQAKLGDHEAPEDTAARVELDEFDRRQEANIRTMSEESLPDVLAQLATGTDGRSETAQLRDVLGEIENAIEAGVSRKTILDALHARGFKLSERGFETALYRLRKNGSAQGQASGRRTARGHRGRAQGRRPECLAEHLPDHLGQAPQGSKNGGRPRVEDHENAAARAEVTGSADRSPG